MEDNTSGVLVYVFSCKYAHPSPIMAMEVTMGFREDLARRIDRKKAEISDLESQVKTAKTYLQALEDMYKMAARETSSATSAATADRTSPPSFRSGSMTGAVY